MLESALEHYRTQKAIAKRAERLALASWRRSAIPAAIALTDLRTEAATESLASVQLMLDEQHIAAPPIAEANPAVIARAPGLPGLISQADSAASLVTLFSTLTADAGRVASGVGIASRPTLQGHIRVLSGASCARCAILAGRFYRWSAGFQRHPRCDCQMVPTNRTPAAGLITSPREALEKGQVRGLSKADTKALDDGADFGRIVNVRKKSSGLTESGRVLTRAGVPTPEGIYRIASDRDEALRLLERFGYIR